MTKSTPNDAEPVLADLVKDIVHDSEILVGQQLLLFRREIRDDLVRAKEAALALGAGSGLVAAGGLLATLGLVHALHRHTRIPLWGCYGLVGGVMGAAGAGLMAAGRARAAGIQFPPPESIGALRENLGWLKEQVTEI